MPESRDPLSQVAELLEPKEPDEQEGPTEDPTDEPSSSPPPAAPPPDPTAGEIRTLTDFAKAAGWEPADVYGLTIKLSETGTEIPIGQLKDTIQDFERERAEFDRQRDLLGQAQQYLSQEMQRVAEHGTQVSRAVLDAQAQVKALELLGSQIPWDDLLRADPVQHANLKLQYQQGYSEAQQALQQAAQEQQHLQARSFQQAAQEQFQRFLQVVPEWRKPEVAQAEGRGMDEMLAALGFTQEERQYRIDARQRVIDRMALLWLRQNQQAAATQQQVKAAPKPVLRPGTGRGVGSLEHRKTAELMDRAKKTRAQPDQLAAISALLGKR